MVVPFAETELHGPLTRLMTCNMTPSPREALAGVELAHIFDTGWARLGRRDCPQTRERSPLGAVTVVPRRLEFG